MDLSNREKKRRKHKKELKSFRNKMGINIIWFDSLPIEKQYSLMFNWKKEKYFKRSIVVPEIKKIRMRRYIKIIKIYPPKLKHYVRIIKKSKRYMSNVCDMRNATIDLLIEGKNN